MELAAGRRTPGPASGPKQPIRTSPISKDKRPQGDLNPCLQDENLMSWTWLDDGVRLMTG